MISFARASPFSTEASEQSLKVLFQDDLFGIVQCHDTEAQLRKGVTLYGGSCQN